MSKSGRGSGSSKDLGKELGKDLAKDPGPTTFEILEQRLGYTFTSKPLLRTSLTHKSFVHENPSLGFDHNERFEFLGDAVLDLAVGHLLMETFVQFSEGELSKRRALLVNEQGLREVSEQVGLGQWLFMGKGEQQTGGRSKASLLADALEAVLAAIYLDGGFEAALAVVRRLFAARVASLESPASEDAKSQLQEIAQAKLKVAPRYVLVSEQGPDHEKTFEVAVQLGEQELGRGVGRSKKEAEQRAARAALAGLADVTALPEP